jgi:hypothetical protein
MAVMSWILAEKQIESLMRRRKGALAEKECLSALQGRAPR